MQKYPEAVVL